jgi:hypothetical protein
MNQVIHHPNAPRGPARRTSGHHESTSATPLLAIPATWGGRAALLVALVTTLRWVIAATTGLSDTEAYYAQWARTPALSYYDHPPLIAWTAWLTTRLSSAPWAVRLGPVLCSVAFDALVYRLAARLFSARAAFFAVAILSAIPVFFFTGFLLNPEALLAPLWALILLLLVDLRDRDERWRVVTLGAVIGVAFIAKYTAVLAVPVALLVFAGTARTRRWLRRPWLLSFAGLVAFAIATPVVAWNALHGWPSLALHLSERMTRPAGEALGAALWRVARGQLILFNPILVVALIGVLGVTVVRARRDERYRLLATASLPVLAFLLTMMVRAGDSEPHWTMVGYLPLVVAAGALLDEGAGPARRFARGAFGAGVMLSAVVGALYLVHMATPALAKRLPSYDPTVDPLAETVGWDRVGNAIGAHATALGAGTVVVAAHNVLCGHVESAVDDTPPVYCASPRRTEYDFVGRRTPPASAPVVFVDSERYPSDAAVALPQHACGPAHDVEIDRAGLHQGRFHIRDCAPLAERAP